MEESAGFDFDDFSVEMEDFKIKKVSEFERIWKIGPGGSVIQKTPHKRRCFILRFMQSQRLCHRRKHRVIDMEIQD